MASRKDQAVPANKAKNKNIIAATGDISGITTRSEARALFAAASAPALTLSKEQEHLRHEPVITLASLRASRGESLRKYSESLPSDADSSGSTTMQVTTTGATSIEEQLAQMNEAITKLTRTAEDKNLQTAGLINRLEAQHGVKMKPSSLPTKKTEEGFNPNAYEPMSKARHDFASSSNLGKKVSNTVDDKERNLTKTQKKLKEHGYGVDNNKAGLGFTPNAPVKISSKVKKASAQHISVSIEQDQKKPKPAPRPSVFDRMSHSSSRISALNRIGSQGRTSVFKRLSVPTSQSSVFERLLKPKKQSNTTISPLRPSASERFEDNEKPFGKRKTTPKEEKFDGSAEKGDVQSLIPSRMKRQAILEVDTKGPLKVRRRIVVHTGKSSCQQTQEDGTEEEIPKKDVTSGSFDSKSSPRLLGACSKSSEIEGWTHVASKKLHEKHMSSPQVHQSERGESSFRQPPKQCENVEDKKISTQRSFMRDLFFLEDLFNFSIKTPCYEDCEECLSKIAAKKLDKQQPSCPQVYQWKRGQNSSCQPPEQCESVGDNEISTQRSSIPITMCDLFPEDFFNYSVKAPSYEDCEERLSQIA